MSAQALADACAALGYPIPRSVLANLENGRRPALSLNELLVLAAALDVPPIALMLPLTPPGPKDDDATTANTVEVLPGVLTSVAEAVLWITGERPLRESRAWSDSALPIADLRRHLLAVQGLLEEQEELDEARARGEFREVELHQIEFNRLANRLRRTREAIRSRGLQPPDLPVELAPAIEQDRADA